jgi:hypothetical protein
MNFLKFKYLIATSHVKLYQKYTDVANVPNTVYIANKDIPCIFGTTTEYIEVTLATPMDTGQ